MTIPPLPAEYTTRGADPDKVADELLWIIGDGIENAPRELQREIGPSAVGSPCARQIGYRQLDYDRINPVREPNWKAAVGTAIHAYLETHFDRFNLMFADSTGGQERFLIEQRVNVGQIGGVDIWGSDDLYDRCTATVVDWKTCSAAKLRDYKANGPGSHQRAQVHLYGRGYVAQGLPVDTVMLVFLPRDGRLRQAHVWHEPYDEQVALEALARANAIDAVVKVGGRAALAALPIAEHYCTTCPYFKAGSTDPAVGCAGVGVGMTSSQPALTLDGVA